MKEAARGEADQLPDGGREVEGEEYLAGIRDRLRRRGAQVGEPVTHGDQGPRAIYSGSRALCFPGPDGIQMEASDGMLTLAELGGSLTAHERTSASGPAA